MSKRGDFTGGMTGQRQRQLSFNAAAIVANTINFARTLDVDINAGGACIQLFSTSSLTTDAVPPLRQRRFGSQAAAAEPESAISREFAAVMAPG